MDKLNLVGALLISDDGSDNFAILWEHLRAIPYQIFKLRGLVRIGFLDQVNSIVQDVRQVLPKDGLFSI